MRNHNKRFIVVLTLILALSVVSPVHAVAAGAFEQSSESTVTQKKGIPLEARSHSIVPGVSMDTYAKRGPLCSGFIDADDDGICDNHATRYSSACMLFNGSGFCGYRNQGYRSEITSGDGVSRGGNEANGYGEALSGNNTSSYRHNSHARSFIDADIDGLCDNYSSREPAGRHYGAAAGCNR